MKKVVNCIKEYNPVIQKKLKEVSVDEGLKIAEELLNILSERKDGIGLAANQIGYDASVAVVNVREPLILINPVIKEQWDEVPYYEGCLSFPGKGCHTKRYRNVIVHTEQEESDWYFSGAESGEEGKGTWEEEGRKQDQELRILESVCVQHEIDHLNGISCIDKAVDTTIRVEKKPGRNEPCPCGSGKKYKKCCINK